MSDPKYIQVYDEKKECWVLRKVDKLPEVYVAKPGWAWAKLEGDIMQHLREEDIRDQWARAAREWVHPVTYVPVIQTHDDVYFTTTANTAPQRYFGVGYNTVDDHAQFTRQAPQRPADPVETRYYAGSGERAERTEPREDQHARRAREYRESLERVRRGRR